MEEDSERMRDDLLEGYAKLRKDDPAAKAVAIFDGGGHLPEILVTLLPEGAFARAEEGQAALAAAAETRA
jgi:hypothetical protein